MTPPITPSHDTVYREQTQRSGVPGLGMRLFLLVYVLFVFLSPLLGNGTATDWTLAGLSVGVFLALYAAVWAAIDRRQDGRALLFTVGMAVLGLALMPLNPGANTYVIYSAALVPFLLPPRWAIAYLAVLAVHVFALQFVPSGTRMIGITTILIVMVGGLNLFYAEQKRRDALLWRAKEDVEEMAALAERERISRDLHDILGHTLSVIALKSELASRLADSDPARAATEIRDVERVSRDALSEVRSAVEGYRSSGLQGELRNAARVLEWAGVRLDVIITAVPSPMPPRQESVLALALREAVTNIARHAQARRCWISLLDRDGTRVLSIRDDGVGGVLREGNGLTGMRERVAAEGGSVTIDGTDGTTITVTLPA